MKRIRFVFGLAAVLFTALSVSSCLDTTFNGDNPELVLSIYIPDTEMTKTAPSIFEKEKQVQNVQVWVFLNHPEEIDDGFMVSYKNFEVGLNQSGLPHSTITRMALPLTNQAFKRLHEGALVDVYAVANMAVDTLVDVNPVSGQSQNTVRLNSNTSRQMLDSVILTGNSFGVTNIVRSFPDKTGLPMSGVLKGVSVSGGYPVLNIPSLTLTRAVSKIRFVFCQQAQTPSGQGPLQPLNSYCEIKRIVFDGMDDEGHECGIANKEYLFTKDTYAETETLFDISGYTSLSATLTGEGGASLLPNDSITCLEFPENLIFKSPGYTSEDARQYETRLYETFADTSQVGPIYLRETDKRISGTIVYSVDGVNEKTATFSLGTSDILARNHAWTVYGYLAEETKTLQLNVIVNPWDWSRYRIDYKSGSVNVIRRFTVLETPPITFKKEEADAGNGFYDVSFWHTARIMVDGQPKDTLNNTITGDIIIATPVGATLRIIPIPGALNNQERMSDAFIVDPLEVPIYMEDPTQIVSGRNENCRIPITIRCNPVYANSTDPAVQARLQGQYIDLHFSVKLRDDYYIDLGSESRDYYRFVLDKNWDQ